MHEAYFKEFCQCYNYLGGTHPAAKKKDKYQKNPPTKRMADHKKA